MADKNEGRTRIDEHTVEYRGQAARDRARRILMEMTGQDNARDAEAVILGRPTLGDGPSVQLLFKAPASMAAYVKAKKNRSEYLRELIARDMHEHGQRLQTA